MRRQIAVRQQAARRAAPPVFLRARLSVRCAAASSDGASWVSKGRRAKHVAMDLLARIATRGALASAGLQAMPTLGHEGPQLLRFPSVEFRSLCLNPLLNSKSGLLDPGTWKRYKVELAQLLLQWARQDPSFHKNLEHLVDLALERDRYSWALQRALQDDQAQPEYTEKLKRKYEQRKSKLLSQYEAWCQITVSNPQFELLRPVLEQVLEVEPVPQVGNKRDGQATELAVSSLLERELPPGWTMHTQCRIVAVDGEQFLNVKMIKGEADILLADPQGIVQVVLEIKTAKGNPYLALYEDVQRFRNMTEMVRGKLVAFIPGHNLPPSTASSITSSLDGMSDTPASPADPQVTLRFSKNVKPVYVLGSAIPPEDLDSVARSAQSKLLTMELGRVLSTQIDAWRDVSLVEINEDAAILQVCSSTFPQCALNIRQYFQQLEACDVFMVQVM